jgi:ATP-binding cassette subfamily B protein/subfamily B ATP-binding cassette protein MsbA
LNPKRPRLHNLLQSFVSEEPAAQLIRQTARQQWRLIALNLGSSLMESFSEGATLGVVFLAVEVLSAPAETSFDWSSNPLLGWWPDLASWLNGLPSTPLFISLLALAVALQALQSLTRFLNLVSVGYFAARCRALVTARIHSQVLSLSYPCASGYKVGDLTDYASRGPEAIRLQIELSSGLLVGVLLIATYLTVLVGISPWLLLVVLLLGGVITLLQKVLLPRIRAGARGVSETQVKISSRITEDFQGLRLLHSSGQLEAADQLLRQRMGQLERQLRGQARRLAVVGPFSSFLPIMAIALIAALSLLLFGERTTGVLPSLVTFVLALQRLNVRISGLANTANRLADNSGRMQRLNQILSPKGKQYRRRGGNHFKALQREIRFENVSLHYAPELPASLSGISFNLPKGQMLALVGPSGAGKTSIADLLTGLYAPTSGTIRIDGTSLDALDLASWQQRLGVVSQDTFLFNATIADNIAFGSPGATPAQIQTSCQAAQAAGFIESLPQGYDTLVGERGYRLSGGQRQRLSLARAILRDPELLILDEATSALDSQSERLVQEAIERFERNHTVLVIAHRLSTIVKADQILVLEGGRVVERGSHRSLLAERGAYHKLWEQQSWDRQ